MSDRAREVERLRRARPRDRLARGTAWALLALAAYAWVSGELRVLDLFRVERLDNVARFLREDVVPYPLRGKGLDAGALWEWGGGLLRERGLPGLAATLGISVLAIVLAGLAGAALCLPGARSFMTPDPFLLAGPPPARARRVLLGAALRLTRAAQLVLRAIPEYIWAYLFLAMLGPSAWPAVLALAIHNAGILGKLGSETVEDLEPAALRSLRALGASRAPIAAVAIFPLALPRFLLLFFYRFETCVREATVLGMLGIVSLGYWIADARGKRFYDEMLFLVLLGAAIVLVGDVVSAVARRLVRRAR